MEKYNILDFGAVGDGKTDDANAIQHAIDSCTLAGGGRVVVPAGYTFLSGPFKLKSFVEFYIQVGATLLANGDEKVYKESAFKQNRGEGTIWIGGADLEQVSICGGGTIDGNGKAFMGEELPDAFELPPFEEVDPRPHMLTIVGCENLKIRNITFKNAAYWSIHLVGCQDVTITEITLKNSLKIRNSDGIDLDHCKDVRISNCHIESGDDCICIKNRREYAEYGPCENIIVTGCTMVSTSCAVKIGSENMDRISHVTFNNCVIKESNRGIGIQHRDEGSVENVMFSNIFVECRHFSDVWWGKAEPIYITAFKRATANHKDAGVRLPENQKTGKVGVVKNIFFQNIKCKSENGIFVSAESADKIVNVQFENIDLEIEKSTNYPGGLYDRRPCEVEGIIQAKTSGFYLDQATSVKIRECSIRWGNKRPEYFGYALESRNVKGLCIRKLVGEAAFPDMSPAIQIHESEETFVKESIS